MNNNVTNSFGQQAIRAGQIHLNAKIDSLNELLADFKTEKFTGMHQVKGHINNQLDILNKLKGER
jgi:hypothetical protein